MSTENFSMCASKNGDTGVMGRPDMTELHEDTSEGYAWRAFLSRKRLDIMSVKFSCARGAMIRACGSASSGCQRCKSCQRQLDNPQDGARTEVPGR